MADNNFYSLDAYNNANYYDVKFNLLIFKNLFTFSLIKNKFLHKIQNLNSKNKKSPIKNEIGSNYLLYNYNDNYDKYKVNFLIKQ